MGPPPLFGTPPHVQTQNEGSPNLEVPKRGPYDKAYNVLGLHWGPPLLGNYQIKKEYGLNSSGIPGSGGQKILGYWRPGLLVVSGEEGIENLS